MPIILYENDVQKAIYILNVAEWSNFQAGHSKGPLQISKIAYHLI